MQKVILAASLAMCAAFCSSASMAQSSSDQPSYTVNFKDTDIHYFDKFPSWKQDLQKDKRKVDALFIEALKTTSLFKQLAIKMQENGYEYNKATFEKLIYSRDEISIPDVSLVFVKK